ncbi:hypothetical protein [Amycolatopsis saalfeldensis]|uniref:hypothetical protein n=1 Tax=Amycolatopsis saalfeldensis TaxID=394193 RepID=UPI001160B57E|nr:hypothetical protein [Amycolatopsis saalfeldensis]
MAVLMPIFRSLPVLRLFLVAGFGLTFGSATGLVLVPGLLSPFGPELVSPFASGLVSGLPSTFGSVLTAGFWAGDIFRSELGFGLLLASGCMVVFGPWSVRPPLS